MDKTLSTDLISREAAVREALRCYRGAQEAVRQCREAEDDIGVLAFSGQKEAFRWMVMALMTMAEAPEPLVVRYPPAPFAPETRR